MRDILIDDDRLEGQPFLEDTRIRVTDIAMKYEKLGYSIEEILQAYERLDRSDVHNALAYFYRNEDNLSKDIEAGVKA
jgi:uncharacterized protein (DUF433 family)